MKREFYLILALVLALVISGGTYAYTYTLATASISPEAAVGDFATSDATATQPDWESLMPDDGEFGSEILRPNAAGDDTNIQDQHPDEGEHWDKVADVEPDDSETYVYTTSKKYERDLYQLEELGEDSVTIDGITVYFRFTGANGEDPAPASARAVIKIGDNVYQGNEETSSTFVTKSDQWTTNPDTGEAWTWEEIDGLQAGVELKKGKDGDVAVCTQVYVAVDYEIPPITEGEVPAGELFTVTPHPDYPGDVLVKVYLTNTGNLTKAYKYINMKLYVEDSFEAGKTPDYQLLTMENGGVIFNIEGGIAASYTVEVVGGSYRLISDDPNEWGGGWSITPEFYCEVSQR